MTANSSPPVGGHLLLGCRAIAEFLGISTRQCLYMVEQNRLPTFRLNGGRQICAYRSALEGFLAGRAAQAVADTERAATV